MEFLRIDLATVLGVAFGGLALLLPILGLTARLAIPPIIDAIGRAWRAQEPDRSLASLERRFARLERQVELLTRDTEGGEAEVEPSRASLAVYGG